MKAIFDDIRASLNEGIRKGSHPFYTTVLVTNQGNQPDARAVMLLQSDRDQRLVLCHSDISL